MTATPDMDSFAAEMEVSAKLATELMDKDPSLPFLSALIIARDMQSSERSLQWLREGKHPFTRCEVFTGSYGRLDFRVRAWRESLITDDEAFADLASTWSGSDPDDTDPRFLDLWEKAAAANGGPLCESPLPRGTTHTVYRGQDRGAPFGISWSLSPVVARRFAHGAATRQRDRRGVVYKSRVANADILGYMTGRNENEVVVNPASLATPRVVR